MNTETTNVVDRAPQHPKLDLWVRRFATGAGVAACAAYQHQRDFALAGGADLTTARLWPLSVDGLLVLSQPETDAAAEKVITLAESRLSRPDDPTSGTWRYAVHASAAAGIHSVEARRRPDISVQICGLR